MWRNMTAFSAAVILTTKLGQVAAVVTQNIFFSKRSLILSAPATKHAIRANFFGAEKGFAKGSAGTGNQQALKHYLRNSPPRSASDQHFATSPPPLHRVLIT